MSEESAESRRKTHKAPDDLELQQMSLFNAVSDEDVLKDLSDLELEKLTPLEALNELYRLQNKLKNRWRADE